MVEHFPRPFPIGRQLKGFAELELQHYENANRDSGNEPMLPGGRDRASDVPKRSVFAHFAELFGISGRDVPKHLAFEEARKLLLKHRHLCPTYS